jgi:hypothetical protein
MKTSSRFGVSMCLLAVTATVASAQYEGELTAKRRLFPEIGAGLRDVKLGPGEKLYVLSSLGLIVFDAKEQKRLTIGSPAPAAAPAASKTAQTAPTTPAAPTFAGDFDVDPSGQIYVADRAANLIAVYSPEGARLRSFPVNAPLSIAALPDGEVAVATLRDPHLVTVFDKNGREIREFGELEDISDRADLNRYLNIGYLTSNSRGDIFYGFIFTPEPTVRQFDRNGYATQTIQFTEIDAFASAQATRKEIERQERKGKQPVFRPILTAVGVAPTGEVWIALHNRLLRFDKDGNRKATYQLYTPDGTRLDATTVLIQKDRILIGSDPLGVFEFERPDIKLEQ